MADDEGGDTGEVDGSVSEELATASAPEPAPTAGLPSSHEIESAPPATKGARLRRGFALLLVLATAVGFVFARDDEQLRDCSTKTEITLERAASAAKTGARSVSTEPAKVTTDVSCEPLPVEATLPMVLLVLALMWPDLSSIEIFGLGRIARRLGEQDARQNQLEAAQLQLQATISSDLRAEQKVINHFSTDPALAVVLEHVLEQRAQDDPQRETVGPKRQGERDKRQRDTSSPAPGERLASFRVAADPLKPWLELARRMRDPSFASRVRSGAGSGALANDPNLLSRDRELLNRIERTGRHPLDVEKLEGWAVENDVQIAAVQDTLHAGEDAAPESLRVATKFAEQLVLDLQRRALVVTD